MDYRELLKKYINHVGCEEGVSFLSDKFMCHQTYLTKEEIEELQKLDKEAQNGV